MPRSSAALLPAAMLPVVMSPAAPLLVTMLPVTMLPVAMLPVAVFPLAMWPVAVFPLATFALSIAVARGLQPPRPEICGWRGSWRGAPRDPRGRQCSGPWIQEDETD
jgi:hypothetical protein